MLTFQPFLHGLFDQRILHGRVECSSKGYETASFPFMAKLSNLPLCVFPYSYVVEHEYLRKIQYHSNLSLYS